MKQSQAEQYDAAWITLAEYIARGKKERALGLYRLLTHDLEDKASVDQLRGDILVACNDILSALQAYRNTASMHETEGNTLQAATMLDCVNYYSELQ